MGDVGGAVAGRGVWVVASAGRYGFFDVSAGAVGAIEIYERTGGACASGDGGAGDGGEFCRAASDGTADGTALATSISDNYGTLSRRADLETLRGGLMPGQYIDIEFADAGITLATYLIDSVTMTTAQNLKRWAVGAMAVAGPVLGSDWRSVLGDLASGGGASTGGGTSGGGGSTATNFTTDQTLTADATIASPGTPTDGQLWIAKVRQDSTGGWTVTWGAPVIVSGAAVIAPGQNSDPSTMCIVTFAGIGGNWYMISSVLGVPAA